MAVNGGAGNAISFSEIQTFYGGTNPISLSEYYRGGSEVPGFSTAVAAQGNTNGSTSQTIGEFSVTVTESNGSLTTSTVSFGSVTILDTHSFVQLSVSGSGTAFFRKNGQQLFATDVGGDAPSTATVNFGGPQNQSGDVSSVTFTASAGDTVTASGSGAANFSGGTQGFRARLFDVSYRNNNTNTITTTSGSNGGALTYTQNQSRLVKNDSSTASYVLGYDAVSANNNTNVPSSGTINIDIFNAPGSPAP
tara:strand:- start:228 stop:977 length:750 start_codon:yes stop_codon:yes gene_type:complete